MLFSNKIVRIRKLERYLYKTLIATKGLSWRSTRHVGDHGPCMGDHLDADLFGSSQGDEDWEGRRLFSRNSGSWWRRGWESLHQWQAEVGFWLRWASTPCTSSAGWRKEYASCKGEPPENAKSDWSPACQQVHEWQCGACLGPYESNPACRQPGHLSFLWRHFHIRSWPFMKQWDIDKLSEIWLFLNFTLFVHGSCWDWVHHEDVHKGERYRFLVWLYEDGSPGERETQWCLRTFGSESSTTTSIHRCFGHCSLPHFCTRAIGTFRWAQELWPGCF